MTNGLNRHSLIGSVVDIFLFLVISISTMEYDNENEMFRLAAEFVNQTTANLFLTGKAGTGKTTFLKYIKENSSKQLAVVAPTGVAAVNAGGVTIHSFFQLPLSPFIPERTTPTGHEKEVTDKHSLL